MNYNLITTLILVAALFLMALKLANTPSCTVDDIEAAFIGFDNEVADAIHDVIFIEDYEETH